MTITPIDSKTTWEAAVARHPEANFLQSWNWGVFQQALGKQIFRFQVEHEGVSHGLFLAVKENAKRGNYLTVAGGPLLDWHNPEVVVFISEQLKQLARQEGCLFIRMRPQAIETPELRTMVAGAGWLPAPMHVTADLTLQLHLTLDPEALLQQMRKNTRSTIRKAERVGITTSFSQDPALIQAFYDHQNALAQRHKFVPFSYQFLHEQFKAFAQDDQVVLVSAYHETKLLAQAFVIIYNHEAVYHYGISTEANSNELPGSYACQWAAILEAQRRGCTRYNFWGIAPEEAKNHRFAGVSLFKRGFGGQEVAYLPAHDLPVSPAYRLTWLFEKGRAWKRGL